MKITKEYIHIITWHRKFLDLQEEITRNHWTGGFYDRYLKGKSGRIRTLTDGSGIEIDGAYEEREEPVAGGSLYFA